MSTEHLNPLPHPHHPAHPQLLKRAILLLLQRVNQRVDTHVRYGTEVVQVEETETGEGEGGEVVQEGVGDGGAVELQGFQVGADA